jgi:hypothetical protein
MNCAQTAQCVYGQRLTAQSVERGAAAWVQSQSTPGASALAAPHQILVMRWTGLWVEQSSAVSIQGPVMNRSHLGVDVALVLLGATGLFAGLSRLSTSPLPAVLIILSAMMFLLFPLAGLCGAELSQARRSARESIRTERPND